MCFNGKCIEEQGNHEELMKLNGNYARLYNMQFKNAKRICVLSHEGIVEEGTHDELLKKKGQYASFYYLGKNMR